MVRVLLLLLVFPITVLSQNYVDIVKLSYAYSFDSQFEDTSESTTVNTVEAGLVFPKVINEKHTFISGLNFDFNNLMLYPESDRTNLYSTTLRLGMASTYSDKWSSMIVLMPKVASDYSSITFDDFYFGGFAILKQKKTEKLFYRYGFYASSEAFGVTFTPILGFYYVSPNDTFEADISLPVAANINYNYGKVSLGFDYFGIERSYNLEPENKLKTYVEQNRWEFASYLQLNKLSKNVLLRLKLGYAHNEHKVFEQGDKVDFKFIAFAFGDDRTRLNPKMQGTLFAKVEFIYRIHFN